MDNRPRSRDKKVSGGSGSVQRRGSGLGTGPVGSSNGRAGGSRPSGGYYHSSGSNHGSSGNGNGSGGKFGAGKLIGLIVVIALMWGMSYMMFGGLLGGGSSNLSDVTDLLSGAGSGSDEFQVGSQGMGNWSLSESTLDTKVAQGSREKYTNILGDGQDVVTIMVYLCGTDLESKHGMATSDLQEMMKATYGDNVNLLVYTGGCKKWKNNVVSSDKQQIYQIKGGKLICLEKDMGSASMTKPATLTKFIQYCAKNFPANRNMLILWDHGGGSLSGYGYDEKNASSGSMDLSEINTALKDAGIKYDFIGFDACLMATLENAMMLTDYADYLIASEETEPGVGWYYTNWLTNLGANTAMPTIEIGKKIVDDFVEVCDRRCNGQKTTLSVVDLAELDHTVPDKLTAFASSTKNLIQNNGYQTVSNARYNTKEFAQSSKIDQVDLVHLAQNLNTAEGKALEQAVLGAVKYNRTSSNMSNANGISIYFPYKKVSKVDAAVAEYREIGMDTEYARCIQEFANVEYSGQANAVESGNSSVGSPLGTLLGSLLSGSVTTESAPSGWTQNQQTQSYVASHSLDASQLQWKRDTDGKYKLMLSEDQWKLVHDVDLNVFVDDGEGYVDLGLDNVFDFDSKGNLIGEYDGTWLSINGQIIAYYHLDTVEEGNHYSISGYVPVLLNGNRAELILVFDDARPDGYLAGARDVYRDEQIQTVAKNLTELKNGDKIEFLCDYYSYDGTYQDSYRLGDAMAYNGTVTISNIRISNGKTQATFRLTDVYQQTYWTPVLP